MRAGPWGGGFTCSTHVLTGRTPIPPLCQRPYPPSPTTISQSPHSTQQLLLFHFTVQSGQRSPPNAPVCGGVCGSLKIPICCPWLGARGAGNSRLWCRNSRELLRLFFLFGFHAHGERAFHSCFESGDDIYLLFEQRQVEMRLILRCICAQCSVFPFAVVPKMNKFL